MKADSDGQPVFVLRDVSKTLSGSQVLAHINLRITPCEQVALIGPSGAGKSTLLSILNGTLAPTNGDVIVLGHRLAQVPPRARRAVQAQIGMIYQQFHLVDNLQVIHNVNAGHLGRWSTPKAIFSLIWPLERRTALQALERVGIPEKLYARTGHLSGGQQQRVALARVLVQNPKAILADEPISSLDPERSREIMDLLRDVCREHGNTLVTSCHSVGFVKTHFQRVIALRAGRLLFDCSTHDLTQPMVDALYRIERPSEQMSMSLQVQVAGA